MTSVAYYRAEAKRCRASAADAKDAATAARWLQIARDYDNLANSLEAAPQSAPPAIHVPMQQQPVQQQQTKTKPDDK